MTYNADYVSMFSSRALKFVLAKTNEIAKFSILDEKNEIRNFGQNLDEKWPADCKKCQSVVKFDVFFFLEEISNSLTYIIGLNRCLK